MRPLKTLAFAAVLSIVSVSSQAATVTCPGLGSPIVGNGGGNTPPTTNRQIQVTGALAGGLCAYTEGNFQGDDFSAFLGQNYFLIDKDVAPNEGAEGGLLYALDSVDRFSGTWAMASNYWTTYAEVFLAFHFGGGSGSPDSFVVQLDPVSQSGDWDLIPTSLANGLSNIYLLGRGTAPPPPPPPQGIPVPGTLLLAGAALLALSRVSGRRRTA